MPCTCSWADGSTPPRCPGSIRPWPVAGLETSCLDIQDLEFIDGAGWLGVIGCEQRVASRGGRLRIDNGIRKILELDPGISRSPGR